MSLDEAIIATNAAIEIDRHICKKYEEKDYNGVFKLAGLISKESVVLDPTNCALFGFVFWPNTRDIKERKIYELYEKIDSFVRDLLLVKDLDVPEQKGLINKCLKLSQGYLQRI